MRIAIVAGEASGDLLGAGLIQAVHARLPQVRFEGIAGPRMAAAGCEVLCPAERLAVMGLVEVLGRYLELAGVRRQLAARWIADPPDVFIGIDAPDFNLGLERRLKDHGIATVHYVSPSVWAWRQYRLRKIARSTDLMLTLFPFESAFYTAHNVPVRFVGHPLADVIPLEINQATARRALDLPANGEMIALLPGSRITEVGALAATFLATAAHCFAQRPGLRFLVPLATARTRQLFEAALRDHPDLPIHLYTGRAHEAMAAANAVLVASGTATLEALLLKRPMVVAYRQAPLTYAITKRLLRVPYVALPNLLAGQMLVPELLQDAAQPAALAAALLRYFTHPEEVNALQNSYKHIHHTLRRDASREAAAAVLDLAEARHK